MSMSLLTFDDLSATVLGKLERSRAGAHEGWQVLFDLLETLRTTSFGEGLTKDRKWCLESFKARGFQGIGPTETVLLFDMTPGITVIHGPNGSGKSSLADGLETALSGSPRSPRAGTGGNLALWDRTHMHRDEESAVTEVVLSHSTQRLTLTCRLDATGTSQRIATFFDGCTTQPVDLGSEWQSALAGYQPVFSYAQTERQVQVAKDLQGFLEPLLAFGGCFLALIEALDLASVSIREAGARWRGALAAA